MTTEPTEHTERQRFRFSVTSVISVVDVTLHADQLVNLRIRTFSTNPKPARVAIIEDPP
jgi:hypothetical protein